MSKASNNNRMGQNNVTQSAEVALTAKEQKEIWCNWFENLSGPQKQEHYGTYCGSKVHRRIFHYDKMMLEMPGVQLVLEGYAQMRSLFPNPDDV